MKRCFACISMVFFLISSAWAGYTYKVNKDHLGGDITPVEAFKMRQKDPGRTFIVDCRTRAEYQYVGHPDNAYNIPLRFLSARPGKKGYIEKDNPNFGKDLLSRFNPETDTLLMICRSGNRSCSACNQAIKAGFKEDKVFNIMGGFEGGKNKNKASAFYGKRWAGGWKLEGLPWTYKMKSDFMYQADFKG